MKKTVLVGLGSLALVVAALFGAFFFTPLSAFASSVINQGATVTNSDTTYCQQFQQDMAKHLNISVDQLKNARQQSASDILDQMVKDGKITQAQADKLKQNLGKHQWCGYNGKGVQSSAVRQYLVQHRTDLVNALSKDLKLTSDQLTSDIKSGKSLVNIAKTQGISEQDLQKDVQDAVTTVLKQGVSQGQLTQNEVDQFTTAMGKHPNYLKLVINHVGKGKKTK